MKNSFVFFSFLSHSVNNKAHHYRITKHLFPVGSVNNKCSQAHSQGEGAVPPPPNQPEKPFFQNVEIRVENCCREGVSDSERRPVLEFIAKLGDYLHFQSKANKELLKKSFLISINLMVSKILSAQTSRMGEPLFFRISETLYRILNLPSEDVARH